MFAISYPFLIALISLCWVLIRILCAVRNRSVRWKREVQLLLVYICIIVVVRFTFFPFGKVDGRIQPLLFDTARVFPPKINLIPFLYLMDYPERRDALLNLMGNTAMFLPLGIVWPCVFRELNSHKKVITAGIGVSLCIEILQLPFFDRVTDIDDLILNSLGFLMGYGIWLLAKSQKKQKP